MLVVIITLAALLGSSCASCTDTQQQHTSNFNTIGIHVPTEPPADKDSARPTIDRVPNRLRDQEFALKHFFRTLERIDSGETGATAKILQIGDSHTASDTSTGRMRVLLQDRFGDAGRGFAHPGMPWHDFRQEQMIYGMAGEWDVYRILYEHSIGPWSVGGVRLESNDPGAIITRRTCTDCRGGTHFGQLTVHYLKRPGGGSFDILLDSRKVATIDTHAKYEQLGIHTVNTHDGAHHVILRVNSYAPVALFGISTTSKSGGIVYSALGINGAQAQHYLRTDPEFTRAAVENIDPDLLILALGPNAAFSRDYRVKNPEDNIIGLLEKLEHYRDQYRKLLRKLKAGAPDASCLVLLPPDLKARNSGMPCSEWTFGPGPIDTPLCITPPPYNYGGIINAQRHAAAIEGCATYEQQRAMGGEGSFSIWQQLGLAQGDGIHFTDAGYDLLADNLYTDLMKAYERWLQGEKSELHTSIIFPSLATTERPREGRDKRSVSIDEQP